MREKKTSMYFGSLVMSFKSVINITKKVSSLVSFITYIVFNDLFRVECDSYVVWEVGRVLLRKHVY